MSPVTIILISGGTLSGLLAGVLYAFSVAVIPGLRSVKAKEHIAVMQSINLKIINPVFFLSFFGPTLLLPLAAFLQRDSPTFPLLLGAAALHILGVNGVTIAGNVPLNDRLARVDVGILTEMEAEQARRAYQGRGSAWMRWHHVRTIASIVATVLVFIACLSHNAAN